MSKANKSARKVIWKGHHISLKLKQFFSFTCMATSTLQLYMILVEVDTQYTNTVKKTWKKSEEESKVRFCGSVYGTWTTVYFRSYGPLSSDSEVVLLPVRLYINWGQSTGGGCIIFLYFEMFASAVPSQDSPSYLGCFPIGLLTSWTHHLFKFGRVCDRVFESNFGRVFCFGA